MTASFNGYTTFTYGLNSNDPEFAFGQQADINVTTTQQAGIYGNSSVDWNVTNSGSITGQTAVAFAGNATFDNTATGKVTDSGALYNALWTEGMGTITNAGAITGVYEPQYGVAATVYLTGGGSLDNVASGTIYGSVELAGYGTVTNAGSISANGHNFSDIWVGGGGQVNNSGYITFGLNGSHASGINLSGGGTVTNSGTIQDTSGSGSYSSGIYLSSSGTASNSGTISLSLNDHVSGIDLYGGGYALNQGTISVSVYEHADGIQLVNSGTATNTGTISVSASYAHASGIELQSGGYALNQGTISISAYQHGSGIDLESGGYALNQGAISIYTNNHMSGVYASGAAAYISNSGGISIVGSAYVSGVELEAGGTFTNSGSVYASATPSAAVQFDAGGTLDNQAGGSIVDVGGAGVYVDGSAGVNITNAGTISGTYFAIYFNNAGAYGNAIVNTVTLDSHAQLIGGVQGSTASYVLNDLVLNGKGTLGSSVYDFQGLTIDKGADWVLTDDDSFSSAITDKGSLTVRASGELSGALTIEKGGVAAFDSSYDGDVTFTGEGELELKDKYTGTISRLVAGDSIDFLSHTYESADTVKSFGDHLLIDNSAGAEITSVTLSSHDSASNFTLGADSAGHLLLTYK